MGLQVSPTDVLADGRRQVLGFCQPSLCNLGRIHGDACNFSDSDNPGHVSETDLNSCPSCLRRVFDVDDYLVRVGRERGLASLTRGGVLRYSPRFILVSYLAIFLYYFVCIRVSACVASSVQFGPFSSSHFLCVICCVLLDVVD